MANRIRILKSLRSDSVPITDMYNFVSKCMHAPSFLVIYFTSFKPYFTFLPVKLEYIFLPGRLHWIVTKIKWMSECKKCFGNLNARARDNDSYIWWLSLHLSSSKHSGQCSVLCFAAPLRVSSWKHTFKCSSAGSKTQIYSVKDKWKLVPKSTLEAAKGEDLSKRGHQDVTHSSHLHLWLRKMFSLIQLDIWKENDKMRSLPFIIHIMPEGYEFDLRHFDLCQLTECAQWWK